MRSIICFGDSITAGKSLAEDKRWTALLQQYLNEKSHTRWNVYNRGIPSDTVVLGLERFDKDVLPWLPSVVLIEFGINDSSCRPEREIPRVGIAEFSTSLGEIVRLVRKSSGTPIFLTNHPLAPDKKEVTTGRKIADLLVPYQDVIRELAAKSSIGLVDLEKHFSRLSGTENYHQSDGIHLNETGHALYARFVFTDLLQLLPAP